jgi:hypothetical protein
LNVWGKEDPFASKARLQIATVFEFNQMYKRTEFLFNQVLAGVKHDGGSGALFHAIKLRLIRLHLLTDRIPLAAKFFREAVAESVDTHHFSAESATFGTWEILEQTLAQTSDRILIKFADELFGALSDWPQAQVALRLQQSRALFTRLLVTDARFRLIEAERSCEKIDGTQDFG